MPHYKEKNKKQSFNLLVNILKDAELRMKGIKDKLYSNERIISVASISPKDRIYEIESSLAEMNCIFESLKPFFKVGEYMAYHSADKCFNKCYSPQNKVIVVKLH